MENDKILFDLLTKYVNEDLNAEELKVLQHWFNTFEGDNDYISSLSEEQQLALEKYMFSKILTNIREDKQKNQYSHAVVRKIGVWVTLAAACFVLLLGVFFYLGNEWPITAERMSISKDDTLFFENKTLVYIKKILPDKSIVWLTPGSSIRYSTDFIKKERNIAMAGECFFDVTKNAECPFIITSEHLVTKVWGTSFRVIDGKSAAAQVAVVTGKVSVKARSLVNKAAGQPISEIMLMANEKVNYSGADKVLSYGTIQKETELRKWSRTRISFDNEYLPGIIDTLNEKFDVNIRLGDESLKEYVLNANFTEFNLPEILDALRKTLNVSYQINQNEIVLTPINY